MVLGVTPRVPEEEEAVGAAVAAIVAVAAAVDAEGELADANPTEPFCVAATGEELLFFAGRDGGCVES